MGDPPPPSEPDPTASSTARVVASASALDAALAGNLPCVTCGYELRGISIRGLCPECGTAVRATILYRVDPYADAFKPVKNRILLASGLVLWSGGALVAAVACWIVRLIDASPQSAFFLNVTSAASWGAVVAVAASAIGAIPLIRPAQGTHPLHSIYAVCAVLAYAPLLLAMASILLRLDPVRASPYFSGAAQPERLFLRFVISASIIVILLGLRPNARELVKRSMVLRTGRVDRQTLLGMAIVSAVIMMGDGLRFFAAASRFPDAELVGVIGIVVVGIGSGLMTIGLVGALIDSIRIARAVLIPSPSLKQVLGHR